MIMPDDFTKNYLLAETKRHKPCLIFHGFRYVQDKIQNRTIYWRCEDRTHCNGRAHQLVDNGALPILTIKHNHQPLTNEFSSNEFMVFHGQPQQTNLKHRSFGKYFRCFFFMMTRAPR